MKCMTNYIEIASGLCAYYNYFTGTKNIYRRPGDGDIDSLINYLSQFISLHAYALQTETFTLALPYHINLQLFKEHTNNSIPSVYEPELFPALRLNLWPSVLVNVFHTGKVVIMGRKARRYLDVISHTLHSIDRKFTF